ncbi:glycosyltransferase family 4 protein [Kaistella pullorum]|uniref:Glycosyltransferase family 4 protein n=1 Tax=Kaistella pullorum TaxID=2763074 RepID=A0ABR8WJ15_9FLAO|nr:glycosyltransferase family 4 protein [Kaistella pullorum]MBD8016995.1 glycosyltransferase family 4 protein [Kaistella pullorum]
MKLLYITNGITGAGGLERVLSVKASWLADHLGYEVDIISLNEEGKNSFFSFSEKVRLHSVEVSGNPVRYLSRYLEGIQKKVLELQPDIISVCDDALKGFLLPAMIRTRAKWIHESHASVQLGDRGEGVPFQKKFQHVLKQYLGRGFARVVLLSERNKNEWTLPQLEVIPNPLPFQTDKLSTLQNKRVIAVGSYSFNKGYDLLLQIWTKIEPEFPDWELNIYGKLTHDNLFAKAEKLNLKNVHFFAPAPDIQEKYVDSSIFVLPSRSEGFGMVIIEAMSCGLPVVSFDCPHGPGDIITDGHDGFLVENGHIEMFAARLQELMSSEELRQEFGTAGRETAKKYMPEKIVKQWDELFRSLVSK